MNEWRVQTVIEEIRLVDEFRAVLEAKCSEEWEELVAAGGDEDEGIEFYADEAWLLSGIRRLAVLLAVIALYRVVEHNLVKLLRTQWPDEIIQQNSLYKADRLQRFLKQQRGIRISQLEGYSAVNTLRVANNQAKHHVANDAAKLETESATDVLNATYEAAKTALPTFLSELANKVTA